MLWGCRVADRRMSIIVLVLAVVTVLLSACASGDAGDPEGPPDTREGHGPRSNIEQDERRAY